MNEIEVEEYIKKRRIVTIPEIQREFDLGYKETQSFITKLLWQEKIYLKDDLNYVYLDKERQIPLLYKQVLWNCIDKGRASFSYIQKRFSLSDAKTDMIIAWMEENHFIGPLPLQKILLSKSSFIDLFGNMETYAEINEEEESTFTSRSSQEFNSFKDFLNVQKDDIEKRINEYEIKQGYIKSKEAKDEDNEDDDFDITKFCDISKIKDEPEENFMASCYDAIEKIIFADEDILQNDFLIIVDKILKSPSIANTNLELVYREVYRNVSYMTEEQFQHIKSVILE